MNLITEKWIPVVFEDGTSGQVGLEQLFREAETIRDLNANPPQRIALMRLFLCITQAALDGPENEEDWKTCRARIIPAALDYLADRVDRFNLYGDRPFLQVNGLIATDNETYEKLDSSLSNELFNHTSIRVCGKASVALNLLTTQCFSLGGTIGVTLWNGYSTKNFTRADHAKGPGPSSDAPCAPSSMLHTIIRGCSLLDSVFHNLMMKSEMCTPFGVPCWDCRTSCPLQLQDKQTKTYLGRLVPLSRAILLNPDEDKCTYAAGLKYESLPHYREPMGTVLLNERKNELYYMGVKLGQHVWRELGAILSLGVSGEDGGAIALRRAGQFGESIIDIWVGGVSRKPGQNLILDVAEWSFSVPSSLLGESELKKYADGVDLASSAEYSLKKATQEYAKEMKVNSGNFSRDATVHYWSVLDSSYQLLVEIASDLQRDQDDWRSVLRKTMHKAFENACPHETPRQIQAYAQARKLLRIREKK